MIVRACGSFPELCRSRIFTKCSHIHPSPSINIKAKKLCLSWLTQGIRKEQGGSLSRPRGGTWPLAERLLRTVPLGARVLEVLVRLWRRWFWFPCCCSDVELIDEDEEEEQSFELQHEKESVSGMGSLSCSSLARSFRCSELPR